jgi:hypothetical protein
VTASEVDVPGEELEKFIVQWPGKWPLRLFLANSAGVPRFASVYPLAASGVAKCIT